MFYKKKNLPEEGDILICTVKDILHNSVFVTLDEYENLEGLIHISELAPGRIRNIRDYVKPNKKIICKAIKINREKKQVDLSLRRVSLTSRKQKDELHKQEIKAEKLLESLGKKLNIGLQDMYNKVGYKAIEEYGYLTSCFQEVVSQGEQILLDLNIDPGLAKQLTELIQEKIQPKKVQISNLFDLECLESNGIEIIKNILIEIEKLSTEDAQIKLNYLGAPKYKIIITSNDYKTAEKKLKQALEQIEKQIKKNKGKFLCQKRS